MSPPTLTTGRLIVRGLDAADAPFIVSLLNDPAFVENIGDRGVRSEPDACAYILKGPQASYERHGFGLGLVQLVRGGAPIGICGLLQRDGLPAPDLGFAFLPAYRSQGYARESASAVMADAHHRLGLAELFAIVNPGNAPSIALLGRLGFVFDRPIRLAPEARELHLFASRREPSAALAAPPAAARR